MILALVIVLGTPLAFGQQPPPGAKDTAKAAAKAFALGKDLFRRRRYVDAVEAFKMAYRLKPHFFVQCSIARCNENFGQMVEAAKAYRRCLREGAAAAPMAAKFKSALKAVEAQITRLRIRSAGAGGDVYVDGRHLGKAPVDTSINPGSHLVEVRRQGAKSVSAKLRVVGGGERELTLTPLDLTSGTSATSGKKPAPRPTQKGWGPKTYPWAWFWSGVVVTTALAAVATVFGVQTLKARSDYESTPTEIGYDKFIARRLLTNIFLGLTAGAAAGSTFIFFYADRKKETARSDTSVNLGLGIRGTF